MADQVKFKKGLSTNLDTLVVENGSIIYTTDDNKLYLESDNMRMQIGNGDTYMNVEYVGGMSSKTGNIFGSGTISLTTNDWDFAIVCSVGGTNWQYSGKAKLLNNSTINIGLQTTSSMQPYTFQASGDSLTYTRVSGSDSVYIESIELYKYV